MINSKYIVSNILLKNKNILLLKFGVDIDNLDWKDCIADSIMLSVSERIFIAYSIKWGTDKCYLKLYLQLNNNSKINKDFLEKYNIRFEFGYDSVCIIKFNTFEQLDNCLPLLLNLL